VRFGFVDAEKAQYPVGVLCRALNVSRSGYYQWLRRPACERDRQDEQLSVSINASHRRSRRRYGSPRIHRDLRAQGIRVGRKRIERIMRERGIVARRKRRFRKTTDSNHPFPTAPNVVSRCFQVERPNTIWAGDITYVWTEEGWLYLAVILDLFSRRVVGWAVDDTLDRRLALAALDRALAARRPPPGLVHHSDRGSQYASHDYRNSLSQRGLICSMSRKGDCWDNAVVESFFSTIKAELLDDDTWPSKAAAENAIAAYIDGFYNLTRRHSTLDYVSPAEFELRFQVAALAA
jgi:putative transposase